MSDDIDIEEHGVMFPDMSIVKTETFDYDDQIPDYDIRVASPLPSTSASEAIPDSTTDLDVSCARVADSPHFVSSTQEEEAASSNRFILGSKPTTQRQVTDCQDSDVDDIDYEHCLSAAVELQDWRPFLEKSRGFCKDCEILFPTANALDVHKMSMHSFLVAVERNVVKEPAKVRKSDGIIERCNVCKKSFANEEELIKHIYMHVNTSMQCDVCPETFFSKQLLEEHKLLHESEELDSDSTETELVHRCHICACQFSRPSIFKRHMQKFHNTTPPNFKTYALDLVCPHCTTAFASLTNLYKHMRRQHQDLFCLKSKPVAKPKYVVKSLKTMKSNPQNASQVQQIIQKSDDQIFVPMSTLFKCSKCNVHFLNSSIAVLHYNNCTGSADNSYTCSQCTLRLKLSCQTAHQKQHIFGKDFDIVDISDEDIRPRILAHCPKCSVHYSEQIFWFHIENCDSDKYSHFKCAQCCISIDEKLRSPHEFCHKMLNYKADDFVIINYGDINSATENKFFRFYMCQTCKCFMNCHSKALFHVNMLCKNIIRNACYLCGLMFTMKTLSRHYGLHERFTNYNVKNFKFFDLGNHEMIQPIPQYHKCNKCKVFFHSRIDLKRHKCKGKYKTCHICTEKYSEAAYKLHMPFHSNMVSSGANTSKVTQKDDKETVTMYYCNICKGYLHQAFHKYTSTISGKCGVKTKHVCQICGVVCSGGGRAHKELHKKQNFKLQNIIFYRIPDMQMIKPPAPSYQPCKKCRVHFCSKMDMITHKCGEENYIKCKICKIDLSTKAYKLHMPFHSYVKVQQPRKHTKAKGITDKEPINEVSSKLTFYQCRRCKFCVTTRKHRHRCATKHPTKRFTCTTCGLCLSTLVFNKHQDAHENDPTFVRENFRIIPFSVAREKTTAATYQIQRKKVGQIADENDTATKVADNTTRGFRSQFYYTLFQCKSCKLCMQHRRHALNHRCKLSLGSSRKHKCLKCGLVFLKKGFNNHMVKHKHDPTYVRKNIKIIAFAPKTKTGISPEVKTNSPIPTIVTKSTEDEDVDVLLGINELEDTVKDESIASTTDDGDKTTDSTSNRIRLTFFQCSSCKLCILNKSDTKYHRCYTTRPAKRYTCAECGLFLSVTVSGKHKWAHENIPTFVRENFNIIPFSPKHTFETIARSSITETVGIEDTMTKRLTYENDTSEINDTMIDDKKTTKNLKYDVTETSKNTECEDSMMVDGQITNNCETDDIYTSDIDISQDERCATTDADDVPKTGANKDSLFTFYQCRTCNICVREKRHILSHRKCFSKVVNGYICKKCGLFLNKRAFPPHEKLHRNPRFVRKNFKIIPFPTISPKTTLREPGKSAKVLMDESSAETETQDNVPELENSAKSKELTETTELENNKKEFIFYQCSFCDLCLMSGSHKNDHCCLPKQNKRYTCKKCGLLFSKLISKKHKQAHKEDPLFVRENFKIISFSLHNNFTESQKQEIETVKLQNSLSYENYKAKKALRNSEIVEKQDTIIEESRTIKTVDDDDTDVSDIDRNADMTSDSDTSDEDEKYSKYTFFQCTECKLCVHFERVIKRHRCVTKVSNKRYTCEKCDLYLSKRVIQQHQSAHENDPLFIRENFKFIHFSPEKDFVFYECSSCKTCWPKKNFAENHNCLRRSGITYKCDYCGLILSSNGFLKHQASHEEDPTFHRSNFQIIPLNIKTKSQADTSEIETVENDSTAVNELRTTKEINDGDTMIALHWHKESAQLDEDQTVHDVHNEREMSTKKGDGDTMPVDEKEELIKSDDNQNIKSTTDTSETDAVENGSTAIDELQTTNKINDGDTIMVLHWHKESAKLDEDQAVRDVHNKREILTKKEDCDTMPVDEKDELIKSDGNQVKVENTIPNDELEARNETAEPTRSKKYTFYRCNICNGCMPENRVPEHYINKWCRNLHQSKRCKKCRNKFIDYEAHTNLHKKVKLYRSKLEIICINNLDDFFDKINKICVFQCHGCKTVLFSRIKMEQHKLSCTVTDISDVTVCEKCRLSICTDDMSLEAHNQQHQERLDFMHENIIVIYFDAFGMINETENTQKHILYECVNCKTCVMTQVSIVNHMSSECTISKPVPCKKCGYTINRHSIGRHYDHHLRFRDMTRENIVLIPFGKKGIEPKRREVSSNAIEQIAANVSDEKEVVKNDGNENITNTESHDASLFLCKPCDVHFMTPKPVSEHALEIHHRPEHIYPCPECGLNFTRNTLIYHKKIHHEACGYKLQDFIIIDIQDLDKSEIKNIGKKPSISLKRKHDGELVKPPIVDMVYQCTCKLSFLCESSFNEHLEQCDGIETKSGLQCSKCELIFDEKQLLRHSLKHHSSDRVFKYNLRPSEELQSMLYRCGNCYEHFLKKTRLFSHLTECSQTSHQSNEETTCSVCNLSIHDTMSDLHKIQHQANIINPKKYIIITYITKTTSYTMYRCNMCYSNFLGEEGLIKHFERFKYEMHTVPVTSLVCDICKVVLNPKGLQEHTKKHHRKLKVETVTPSTSSSKPKIATKMQINQNKVETSPSSTSSSKPKIATKMQINQNKVETSPSSTSSSKPEIATKMQINQNKVETSPSSTSSSKPKIATKMQINQNKDKNKVETSSSSTSSSKPEIATKMQINQNKLDTINPSTSFNNNLYYCEVCRLHFENEKSFLCHYRTIRKYQPCDICALVFPNDSLSSHVEEHHVKLNLKLEDFHIIKSYCVKENPAKDKTLGKNVPANKEKIERKVYFKCKNCNVTFLSRKNCLKHVKRHIPVPEYDFVACKICNKNFLVDSLRYHMMHHKSMELNDSTLLTITYSTDYDLDESNITKKTNKFLLGKSSHDISEITDSEEDSQKSPENASDDENNSDNIHSCHLCKKKYKTERARDLHVSLDHLDEEKECPICKKTYHLSILNDLHLCMKDDLFKCCVCRNVFQTLLMDTHSREHVDSEEVTE